MIIDSSLNIATLPKDIKTDIADNEYIVYIDILTSNNYEYGATFVVTMMNTAFQWYIECLQNGKICAENEKSCSDI